MNATSSNPHDGLNFVLKICEDNVGGHPISWGGGNNISWAFGTSTASTTANGAVMVGGVYDARTSRYDVITSTILPTGSCQP